MPMPKSITKINKSGVTYISSVDRVQYSIVELTRAALKDIAKLTRLVAKNSIPVVRGILKENIATWVRKDKYTGQLELQLGVYAPNISAKKGKRPAIHAHMLEFGTKKMTAQPFLAPAVFDNIAEITRIESMYLGLLSSDEESKILGLIDESEVVDDV